MSNTPVSFAKGDLVSAAVAANGYTGRKAVVAQAAGSDAYDWLAMRSGQLNPAQRHEQEVACRLYVQQLADGRVTAAGPTPVGATFDDEPVAGEPHAVGFGMIVGWILAAIVEAIVAWIVTRILENEFSTKTFQAMHHE